MAPFVASGKPVAPPRQHADTRDLGAGSPSVMGAAPAPKALLSDKYIMGEELGRGAFGQVQLPQTQHADAALHLPRLPTWDNMLWQ